MPGSFENKADTGRKYTILCYLTPTLYLSKRLIRLTSYQIKYLTHYYKGGLEKTLFTLFI